MQLQRRLGFAEIYTPACLNSFVLKVKKKIEEKCAFLEEISKLSSWIVIQYFNLGIEKVLSKKQLFQSENKYKCQQSTNLWKDTIKTKILNFYLQFY